jgi:hypothetical protein
VANLEVFAIALGVVGATDEAGAVGTAGSVVAEHKYTLAIGLTARWHTRPGVACVQERTLLIGLARRGARAVNAARIFVDTIAVLATFGTAAVNAERRGEPRALDIV